MAKLPVIALLAATAAFAQSGQIFEIYKFGDGTGGETRYFDDDLVEYVAITAPSAVAASYTLRLPAELPAETGCLTVDPDGAVNAVACAAGAGQSAGPDFHVQLSNGLGGFKRLEGSGTAIVDGFLQASGINPTADSAHDLGTTDNRWRWVYGDVHVGNEFEINESGNRTHMIQGWQENVTFVRDSTNGVFMEWNSSNNAGAPRMAVTGHFIPNAFSGVYDLGYPTNRWNAWLEDVDIAGDLTITGFLVADGLKPTNPFDFGAGTGHDIGTTDERWRWGFADTWNAREFQLQHPDTGFFSHSIEQTGVVNVTGVYNSTGVELMVWDSVSTPPRVILKGDLIPSGLDGVYTLGRVNNRWDAWLQDVNVAGDLTLTGFLIADGLKPMNPFDWQTGTGHDVGTDDERWRWGFADTWNAREFQIQDSFAGTFSHSFQNGGQDNVTQVRNSSDGLFMLWSSTGANPYITLKGSFIPDTTVAAYDLGTVFNRWNGWFEDLNVAGAVTVATLTAGAVNPLAHSGHDLGQQDLRWRFTFADTTVAREFQAKSGSVISHSFRYHQQNITTFRNSSNETFMTLESSGPTQRLLMSADIIPNADELYDIGSTGFRWNAYIHNLDVSGTVTGLDDLGSSGVNGSVQLSNGAGGFRSDTTATIQGGVLNINIHPTAGLNEGGHLTLIGNTAHDVNWNFDSYQGDLRLFPSGSASGVNEIQMLPTGGGQVELCINCSTPGATLHVGGPTILSGAATVYGNLNAQDVLPRTHNTFDLGSPAARWAQIWAHDADFSDHIQVTGITTGRTGSTDGKITFLHSNATGAMIEILPGSVLRTNATAFLPTFTAQDLGNASQRWDLWAGDVNAGHVGTNSLSANSFTLNGALTATAVLPPFTNTYDVGSVEKRWRWGFAQVFNANEFVTASGTQLYHRIKVGSFANMTRVSNSVDDRFMEWHSHTTPQYMLMSADIRPFSHGVYDLGTNINRWNAYIQDLDVWGPIWQTNTGQSSQIVIGPFGNFYNRVPGGFSTSLACPTFNVPSGNGWTAVGTDGYLVVCINNTRYRVALTPF